MGAFPIEIRDYVARAKWIFAKTYATTWPHYYLALRNEPEEDFLKLVNHIRDHGYAGKFFKMDITYYDEDGMTYWTMVQPVGHPDWYPPEKEDIINRCPKADTYEERVKTGRLPKETKPDS